MTDEEFAAGVDAIIATERKHAAHRALDLLWTRYAREKGGVIAAATERWLEAVEAGHDPDKGYPPEQFWTVAELETLASLRLAGMGFTAIGRQMERSRDSVRKAYVRHALYSNSTTARARQPQRIARPGGSDRATGLSHR